MSWKPFSTEVEKKITDAITKAESECSGEIRVHVDEYCKSDPVFKAKNVFTHLKMEETELRNGVLIYVAMFDRKFAIIGDKGIHEKVGDDFWDKTKEIMLAEFIKGDIPAGIIDGINIAAEQLKKYFSADDTLGNELSNDISYGS
ncbi:MAG: TPM domain-containing protein [Flavobacteriales bacterium]|nr:TPM domain-containing protein [Flavobacteriales bacterium]